MPNSTTFPVCAFANTAWLTNVYASRKPPTAVSRTPTSNVSFRVRIPVMFARIRGSVARFKSGGGARSPAKNHSGEHRRRSREHCADEERGLVPAGQRREVTVARCQQCLAPRGGDAGEDRQPEGAAHHERCVDKTRGETRIVRLDVTHRGEQQRIEGHAGAEAEQDHAR